MEVVYDAYAYGATILCSSGVDAEITIRQVFLNASKYSFMLTQKIKKATAVSKLEANSILYF